LSRSVDYNSGQSLVGVLLLDSYLSFYSENKMSTHEGGFVRRFACRHEVPSTKSSDIKTHAKTMLGELEVAVIADHSHRLFAGRRTVVRFCLVG
jgi:hypothetical protein